MNPKTAAASEIYSADGKLLGKFFSENRTPVSYDSIAPNFFDALISTEDERFYSHHGVDFVGIGAAAKDAVTGHATWSVHHHPTVGEKYVSCSH